LDPDNNASTQAGDSITLQVVFTTIGATPVQYTSSMVYLTPVIDQVNAGLLRCAFFAGVTST